MGAVIGIAIITILLALNIILHLLSPSTILIPESQMTTVTLVELFGLAVIVSSKAQVGNKKQKVDQVR